ncbi:MAG: Rrf2 family transcriptional regulator [bacterium]
MISMLAITEATSIAIHLCVRLTQTGTKFYSTRKVAEEFDLSVHHLAKVVQKLVKAGILESSRGGQGGVRLLKPMEELSVFELHTAVVDLEKGTCLLNPKICAGCTCALGKWMAAENKMIQDVLQQTTIKGIADSLNSDSSVLNVE